MRFDLHIHSRHSADSRQPVEQILRVARARGLDGIAITDHNTLAGSLEALELNRDPAFYIIPGAEYATDQGHILAYFIDRELGLGHLPVDGFGRYPWAEVVKAIHARGGLAFLAHPFKHTREVPEAVWRELDGVEAFNCRACHGKNPEANRQAEETAARYRLAVSAGSDAHWPGEIGSAVWELPGPPGRLSLEDIKQALASGAGEITGQLTSPLFEPASQAVKVFKTGHWGYLPKVAAKLALVGLKEIAYRHRSGIGSRKSNRKQEARGTKQE